MDTYGRLNELLAERHMSMYQIAKLSNMSHSTLANPKSRGGQLSVDTIERICNAMGITLGEFFTPNTGDNAG